MMSGVMSLLHDLSRLILPCLVIGICISMPHLSSLLEFLCLQWWWYMWHIDIYLLGFVCGFRQSFFSIRSMFPITWMNVVIVFAASSVQINLQVSNHVSRCTAERILSAPWLKPLHTPFIGVSFQMEAIVSDIHMIERECSVLVFFFLCFSFLCRLTILTILMYIVV